jgi:ribosomal protein S18 acetylase RimI-like enzyme
MKYKNASPSKMKPNITFNIKISSKPPCKRILEAVERGFEQFDRETILHRNTVKNFYLVIENKKSFKGFLKARLSWGNFHIVELFVPENFRHCGIGTALLKECLKVAQKEGASFISVKTSNPTAKKLYEKLGFLLHNTLSGYHFNLEFYTLIYRLN